MNSGMLVKLSTWYIVPYYITFFVAMSHNFILLSIFQISLVQLSKFNWCDWRHGRHFRSFANSK